VSEDGRVKRKKFNYVGEDDFKKEGKIDVLTKLLLDPDDNKYSRLCLRFVFFSSLSSSSLS